MTTPMITPLLLLLGLLTTTGPLTMKHLELKMDLGNVIVRAGGSRTGVTQPG